ncbi:protein pxr1-like [Lotus japonicus]|uniref:protein pxr1-like n=1 Tax=Lotus japonicus TaxID=34305 RepID=UPI0025848DE4|nr:protein pxr1-like [Lotus japonicus]
MTQDSGKKIVAGPKPIKNSYGVKFLGLKTASSTPSRVTRSSAKIVTPESSGPAKRTRSMRIKHVVKRGTGKASSVQDISEDSIPDPPVDDNQESDVVDAEADQVIHNVLETLADVATAQDVMPNVESQDDRDSEPNSEANPSELDTEKEDDTDVASQESSSEKTPSVEIPHEKTPEPLSKKGKKQVSVASEEEDSDDQEVHKKVIASASKKATVSTNKNVAGLKEKKKKVPGSQTPKTPKASQVSVPEKKTKKDKKDEKIVASTGKKRKHVAETDSELDVPDITTTAKKRIKGKRIPLNVPEAPIDNVSFHFASSAQIWKFVV